MDNYEVVTNIGKGSSGSVFLAKSLKLRKLVAVKEIEIDENRRSRCKKSVVREASLLRRMVHPCIVECIEWFLDEEERLIRIVLEYCNGGTLQDLVRAAKSKCSHFPEQKILKWMAEITSAVEYMHERRILHRDLKPENIFIMKPDIAKLGDFGISKEIDHTLDLAQTCVGTPCYLSPELCQDIPYNSKSDIWALGCLLFEMAALKPAFDAANLVSLFYKIVKGEYAELPESCSSDICELVNRILQKEPEKRPTASQILSFGSLTRYIPQGAKTLKIKKQGELTVSPNDAQLMAEGRKRAPKLAELRLKSSAIEQSNSLETHDTITNDTYQRTLSPSPAYAYNMFLSGTKAKSSLEFGSKIQGRLLPAIVTHRSNSVLETSIDKVMEKPREIPKLFEDDDQKRVEGGKDDTEEIETARPQTCPHSASRRVAQDYAKDSFTDTVVTWSGYGDRGSRHHSGHIRHRDSVSLSSGSINSSSDCDSEHETSQSKMTNSQERGRGVYSDDSDSDSCLSSNEDSDEISEESIPDEHGGEDEIPEVIETHTGTDFDDGSITNSFCGGDNTKVLPGSGWLRSKRMQVLQQKSRDLEAGDRSNNSNNKRKARLPGSSWLSRKHKLEQRSNSKGLESSSDDAIVLGQENDDQTDREKRQRWKKRNGRIRNLPGSAWLKNTRAPPKQISSEGGQKGPHSLRDREKSMVLESCGSSNAEQSNSDTRQSESDLVADDDGYPDDFDDYEDDFEPSDDSDDCDSPANQKSSLDIVRQGCMDLLGVEVFNDLSALFKRGLTLSEVVAKFKKRKVDSETLEACYLLIQNKN